MINQNDELAGIGYVSSATDFSPVDIPTIKDEADLSTLEEILILLNDRKTYFQSVNSLSYGEALTVENQLIINKKVLSHIQELETMVMGAINKVRIKQNG